MFDRALIRKVIVTAALVLFAAAEVSAQEWIGRGRLFGTVKDPDGTPIQGATVTMVLKRLGDGPAPVVTDRRGRFSYLGLTTGRWELTFEADGFQTMIAEAQLSQMGFGAPLEIELEPLPEEYHMQQRLLEAQEWIERGNAFMEEGRFAEAREQFLEAASIVDQQFRPILLLGVARATYAGGDPEGAVSALEEALTIDPSDQEALRLMIAILAAEGRAEEAEALLAERAEEIELDPVTAVNLGVEAYNQHDYTAAELYFEQALAADPELAEGVYFLALTQLAQGRTEEARHGFECLLEIEPDGPRAEHAREILELLGGDG